MILSAVTGLLIGLSASGFAKTQEYSLVIDRQAVNITGKPLKRITINGSIPGPTLEFTEGDEAVIHVINQMEEDTSVHWHGLLVPSEMDGVPGLSGFAGIKPGETFTYRFTVRQDGTYWYHAHSTAQEQDGHYGSIIIHPKGGDTVRTDRDYVVLLSDFHDDEGKIIMSNLKKSSEYYVYARRTVGDFFADVKAQGFGKAWKNAKMWGEMRMLPTDLTDVGNYTFLVNGKTPEQNWTGLFEPGEKIRLRFINASSMSFYDVRIPGLKMTVVASDGQSIEPVEVDEFRFGVAETYDVVVEPKEDKAYTIAAESIDRTGFALATLASSAGMRGAIPTARPRNLLTMADMGMADMGMAHDMPAMEHTMNSTQEAAPAEQPMHDNHQMAASDAPAEDFDTGTAGSGWAEAGTPEGHTALAYKDLRYAGIQPDQRLPQREIIVRFGGDMGRYIWTLNDRKYEDSGPISLNYGERVRLIFVNGTMMAHPMHLHGMFVQLENGQPMAKLPNKHTVIVAPGDTYAVLLTADEAGEWAFHCHLLYHTMAGMMKKVVVARLDGNQVPAESYAPQYAPQAAQTDHQNMPAGKHDEVAMDHSHQNMPAVPVTQTETQGHATGHGRVPQQSAPTAFAGKAHGSTIHHALRLETGAGSSSDGTDIADWDFEGWIGTDENKLWLRSEGEPVAGKIEQAEFWAMYSRNIGAFWDLQVGVRHDTKPYALTYGVIGFEGIAPYFLETEAHLFMQEGGGFSARLRQEKEFLLTQKWMIQPYIEANLFAQDVPELNVGSGLSSAEFGIQLRYEFTRSFAPYVELKYERQFGETASIAKSNAEDSGAFVGTVGIKFLF